MPGERAPARDGRPRIFIDRGGTFTDCILEDSATGQLSAVKVLSADRAPIVGIQKLLGLGPSEPIPPCEVRLGTTIATNALLERRGTPCLLVITRGFADLLTIGTQARPDLFALDIATPAPLASTVIEVDARRAADGEILARPDLAELERSLTRARSAGIASAAIAVLHDYADGSLERDIAEVVRRVGFAHVALAHELCPELGFLSRAETAVLDAYLTPALARYLAALAAELPGSGCW
jgi:5-oxoprolinase (ATP-hydrolysing)